MKLFVTCLFLDRKDKTKFFHSHLSFTENTPVTHASHSRQKMATERGGDFRPRTKSALLGLAATTFVVVVIAFGVLLWWVSAGAHDAVKDTLTGTKRAGSAQHLGIGDDAAPIVESVGEALADKTVTGVDPATLTPFAIYFGVDGAAPRSDGGKLQHGAWHARDDTLFVAWPELRSSSLASRYHPEHPLFQFARAGMIGIKLRLLAPGLVGEVVPDLDPNQVQSTWTVTEGDVFGLGSRLVQQQQQQQQYQQQPHTAAGRRVIHRPQPSMQQQSQHHPSSLPPARQQQHPHPFGDAGGQQQQQGQGHTVFKPFAAASRTD